MESTLTCVYTSIYCLGAGKGTFMSISDGLGPYFLCRKMEKMRYMGEGMGGKVFISRQSWHFFPL